MPNVQTRIDFTDFTAKLLGIPRYVMDKIRRLGTWTDYPISELGDKPDNAPLRKVHVISYDGNKYCMVKVEGYTVEIKAGYLYREPVRNGEPIRTKGLKRTKP